ncbi:hypothetical protein TSAR_000595 [Trichomalopsis sarcophagae]|uniref:Uncharacterized protein n=1 Tax=Trichomalopsis sarcophagae TaxID=543379 RepID=A0A232EHK4_9HYME|nr:hypothetical protein TSAR_000595 [Trichomalopsis sarcophagae]
MSVDHSSSDLGAFANKCALKIDYLELITRPGALLLMFNKNLSPVSSEMSIDRLSNAFVAFAEEIEISFFRTLL